MMNKANAAISSRQLSLEHGRILISGPLTFATVTDLWTASENLFPREAEWNCDLAAVSACDSAGLALLLEWLRLARQQKKKIHFLNLPQQLEAIAGAAGLKGLLGV